MDQPRLTPATIACDGQPEPVPVRRSRGAATGPQVAGPEALVDITYRLGSIRVPTVPPLLTSLQRRFLAKIDTTGTCWLWKGARLPSGYGVIWVVGKGNEYAHRVAYELFNGPIPRGLDCCHSCDNPSCVTPEHLFLGTAQDNLNDAVAKGRIPHGSAHYNAKLTEEDVRRIRSLREAGTPATGLCQQYGISFLTVWRILHRKTWAWLP